MKNTRLFPLLLCLIGAGLRIGLYWVNPPYNGFDDHFEPILLALQHGSWPVRDACWECFQPPVFYKLAYWYAKLLMELGVRGVDLPGYLQALPCAYGVLTLPAVWLVLRRLPLAAFVRLSAFAIICFLPQHIYISAFFSNDSLSYLLTCVCCWLLLEVVLRKAHWLWCLGYGLCTTAAIFSKYPPAVLIPTAACALLLLCWQKRISTQRLVLGLGLCALVPLLFLGPYMYGNYQRYGHPLPLNTRLMDIHLTQRPGAGHVDFFNFKPWTYMGRPLITDRNIDSFWTQVYGAFWFEVEPRILYLTQGSPEIWQEYTAFLNNNRKDFPLPLPLDKPLALLGSALILLGLVPLLMLLLGLGRLRLPRAPADPDTDLSPFYAAMAVLLFSNTAGIIYHAAANPFYSSMKASFFLISLTPGAVFMARGAELLQKSCWLKRAYVLVIGLLSLLVTFHILRVVVLSLMYY